jgi:hypothetical protein
MRTAGSLAPICSTAAKWGMEAQIIEAPDDLRIGHRFDHREQAFVGRSRSAATWSAGTSTGLSVSIRHEVSLVPLRLRMLKPRSRRRTKCYRKGK